MKLFSLSVFHPGPSGSKATFLITEFLLFISFFLLLTWALLYFAPGWEGGALNTFVAFPLESQLENEDVNHLPL